MKKNGFAAACLAIIIFTVMFTGCGAKMGLKDEVSDERPAVSVYYLKDHNYYNTALGSYIYSHSKKYNVSLTPFDTDEEMAARLTEELADGKGPDVILLSSESDFDTYKALKSGEIADLSSYFAKDGSFLGDDYYGPAMNGGIYRGGQYLVPFTFSIDTLCIDESVLGDIGYGIDRWNDFYDFAEGVRALCDYADDGTMAITISRRRVQSDFTKRFLADSGIDLIDENGTISDTIENFKTVMELLALIEDEYEKKEDVFSEIKSGYPYAFGKTVCFSDNANQLLVQSGTISMMENVRGTSCVALPWKNTQGQVQPVVCDYGFVNENSKSREAAYNLLRYLMDYDSPFDFNFSLSVKKELVEKNLLKLQRGKKVLYRLEDGTEITTLQIDDTKAEEILDMFEHMADAIWYNAGYYSIVSDRMEDYLINKDDRDMDSAFEELQTALQQYIAAVP